MAAEESIGVFREAEQAASWVKEEMMNVDNTQDVGSYESGDDRLPGRTKKVSTDLGIIHDINNLIQQVSLSTEILIRDEGLSQTQLKHLANIRNGAVRSRELLQLMAQQRREETVTSTENIDVEALLRDAASLILSHGGIDVEFLLLLPLRPVRGNYCDLFRVFCNLFCNSREAMSGSGCVQIRAENIGLDERGCRCLGEPHRSCVRIVVKDTGCGIPLEVQRWVFVSGFTTKAEGNGLGLLNCRRIVESLAGNIRVLPNSENGAAFEILLPAVAVDSPQ